MLEEESQESNNRSLKDRALRIGSMVTSVVALASGVAAGPAAAEASPVSQTGIALAERSNRLRPISELPGYGMEISKTQADKLKNATVKISEVFRAGGQTEYSEEKCSGVKVNIGGKQFVLTAAHCLKSLTGGEFGIIKGPQAGPKAADIYKISQNLGFNSAHQREHMDYEISDPKLPDNEHGRAPIAIGTGLVISLEGLDYSLIQVKPEVNVGGAHQWRDIHALDYLAVLSAVKAGQEAMIYGAPNAQNGSSRLVGKKGFYLGRYEWPQYSSLSNSEFDVVAINPTSAGEDPCRAGGSGSAGILSDGRYLGPLSESLNLGYKNGKHSPVSADKRSEWDAIQRQLGVKISLKEFNTLCLFSVPHPSTIKALVNGVGDNLTTQELAALRKA